MAFRCEIYCSVCGEAKTVICSTDSFPSSICRDCKNAEEAKKKKEHLDRLSTLTIEERIQKIEEWMYEHGKTPHGYQPPPRF